MGLMREQREETTDGTCVVHSPKSARLPSAFMFIGGPPSFETITSETALVWFVKSDVYVGLSSWHSGSRHSRLESDRSLP